MMNNLLIPSRSWVVDITEKGNKLKEKCVDVQLPMVEADKSTADRLKLYIDTACDPVEGPKLGLQPGVGIAAPQIRINKRMFYIKYPLPVKNGKRRYKEYLFVNPILKPIGDKTSYLYGGEGCLSIKDRVAGIVPRHFKINIKAYDYLQDKIISMDCSGYLAIVLQHEFDHLNGVLYPERINKKDIWHTEKEWKEI